MIHGPFASPTSHLKPYSNKLHICCFHFLLLNFQDSTKQEIYLEKLSLENFLENYGFFSKNVILRKKNASDYLLL